MENLSLNVKVNPQLYIKDPDSSKLGKKIVDESIRLIDEMGFETFTFKKLGEAIGSTESSIYRYFANKHILLVYLTCWYWSWIEYKLVFLTTNVSDKKHKLTKAIEILTCPVKEDTLNDNIREIILTRIIISESVKTYHTKEVDNENQNGYYAVYKRIVKRVGMMVLDVRPSYSFPNMLISTIIEGVNAQRYFQEHLPSLSNSSKKRDNVLDFYKELVFKALA